MARVGWGIAVAGLCCGGLGLGAADLVWTNAAGGAWNTAANWSPNQVPTFDDRVWITNTGT